MGKGSTVAALTEGRGMGRKRTTKPPKNLALPLRRFAEHLSTLVGDSAPRVAEAVGVSSDSVRKWCRGDMVPNLEHWPKLATAVGLSDWRELLPPLKK